MHNTSPTGHLKGNINFIFLVNYSGMYYVDKDYTKNMKIVLYGLISHFKQIVNSKKCKNILS